MKPITRVGLTGASVLVLAMSAGCTGDDDDDAFSGDTEVSGTVSSITTAGEVLLAGATVEVVDGGPSTTSAAGGTWTLMLASNSSLTVRASAADHWGAEVATVVEPGGLDLDFGLPSDALVNAIGAALGAGAPDETAGIVAVDFFGVVSTAGGLTVSLSAANDGSFTFNSAGNPVLSNRTLPNGDDTLIFINVAPGTTTLTVTSTGGLSCTNPFSVTSHPVDAKVVTQAPFFCQ